jgi:two-component sensor histidine kinase
VFQQILNLVGELFASYRATVETKIEGRFGEIPSERATPLAIALTEIVSNAVEHGLRDRSGVVMVSVNRENNRLDIEVTDDGIGMPEGKEGSGLGTQIIRSLVEGELRGNIGWTSPIRGGTRVKLSIPC